MATSHVYVPQRTAVSLQQGEQTRDQPSCIGEHEQTAGYRDASARSSGCPKRCACASYLQLSELSSVEHPTSLSRRSFGSCIWVQLSGYPWLRASHEVPAGLSSGLWCPVKAGLGWVRTSVPKLTDSIVGSLPTGLPDHMVAGFLRGK